MTNFQSNMGTRLHLLLNKVFKGPSQVMPVEAEGGTWYLVGKTSWLKQASGLRAFLPENHIQLRIMELLHVTCLL